jgi:Flp pilus assembly protein TadD
MPQVETDIPHIAFTHHRIGIHNSAIGPASEAESQGPPVVLVAYGDISHVVQSEQERGLGLAYLETYSKHAGRPEFESYRRRARDLLEASLARSGNDGEVAAGLAKLYWSDDDPRALDFALAALRDSRTSTSARVNALLVAGDLHFRHGRPEAALPHLEELTRRRRLAEDHLLLAGCRAQLGRLDEAEQTARVALEIDPFRPDAYELLVKINHSRGDPSAAAEFLQKMEQLTPGDRE